MESLSTTDESTDASDDETESGVTESGTDAQSDEQEIEVEEDDEEVESDYDVPQSLFPMNWNQDIIAPPCPSGTSNYSRFLSAVEQDRAHYFSFGTLLGHCLFYK